VCLACDVTVTKTTVDAIAFFETALAEVKVLLDITWIEDLTDPDTGEIGKLVLVTDNGPCFKSAKFAAWVAAQRHITHVRTRKNSPWTNGQIERFFRSIKYDDLYRNDISDGVVLARRVENYLTVYNSIRPHEPIGMRRPLELYRQPPNLVADEDAFDDGAEGGLFVGSNWVMASRRSCQSWCWGRAWC
jgi:putative transposase